ncbi:MAG: regulatory protein RecX [Bacillota bacterium]|nr:regulatory protein RecX [Bacillota bacterium]
MTPLERAVSYLTVRPRTRKQVSEYLSEKGCSEEEVREVIKQLEEYNYIDDEEYTRMYFARGFAKGHGEFRIKRELSQKGVDGNIIEDVIFDLREKDEVPDQFQIAMQIGLDMLGRENLADMEYKERKKVEARIGRRLMSRGFDSSTVYGVLRALEDRH